MLGMLFGRAMCSRSQRNVQRCLESRFKDKLALLQEKDHCSRKKVCVKISIIQHTFDIDLHLHVVTYRAGLRLLRELLWQLSAQTSMVLVPAEAWSKNGSVISVLRFLGWGVKKENAISLLRERAEESWQDWNAWNSRQFSFFVAVGCVVLSFPAFEFQKRHQETWSNIKHT